MRRKSWALVTTAAALLVIAIVLLQVRPAAAGTRWGANYFPNTELTDQNGRKLKFYDDLIKGKIVVIDFIYTHCVDACPLETARLAQVQKMLGDRMGKDIFFYSISIDPERDTPEQLKAYAENYHAGPGWLFLTGNKDEITELSKKLGLYTEPDPEDRDGHAPRILLGNEPTGQWMQNSATDNARFMATLIGDWLNSWKGGKAQTAGKSYAEAAPLNFEHGQYVFATHCAACHTIGHGTKIGPDLLGVTNVRERKWLVRFVQTPDKLLAEKDPIATALFKQYKQVQMPNLRLADVDVKSVVDFLEAQTAAAAAQEHHHHEAAPAGAKTEAGATTKTGATLR